ncbi:enoyl-CoA hydratase/isomerase family protein [uncultured Desulfosarcina sp.]|uniref:enoyl-CoA hydratase/isomerase family protein n=1 Tax=uncultured Desulfosarcina sp. TaxID=218289 RepID=UPI0029C7D07C|nr:enoyl-CoA hydratase/isomerase family protein [uncultured Desulfosarcina sp.]
MSNFIRTEIEGNVAFIVVDRPQKMNALNTAILKELLNCLDSVDRNDDIRVVVLRGEGEKAFIVGADIQELANMSAYEYREFGMLFTSISERIMTLSKPVIAAVNGVAFGGGCLVAISCDLVVADAGARFGFQEVNLGFMGATGMLPKLVGKHRAAEITMLGGTLSAKEAHGMGLVNKIADDGELEAVVDEISRRLIEQSSMALHLIKRSLLVALDAGLSVSSRYETELSSICVAGDPAQRRIARYLQR